MIHFDSHTDAAPAFAGTRNHAAGFRIGAEDGLLDPRRTVQIGIRGHMASPAMDDWARENFARVFTTMDVVEQGVEPVLREVRRIIGDGPTYLSFDLDAIDPAYAPGVADPEVNGLTVGEVVRLLQGFRGVNLMGADIVCYCPPLDNAAQITALTISSMMLELVTLIARLKTRKRAATFLSSKRRERRTARASTNRAERLAVGQTSLPSSVFRGGIAQDFAFARQ